MNVVRVGAVQFSTGTNTADNLTTTLDAIDRGAAERLQVLVLPEFCNHLSVYDNAEHAYEVAIDIDGEWTTAVAQAAQRHDMWIQLNCTVRRAQRTANAEPRITNTNLLFSPHGGLVRETDKTVLMGAEGDFLSPATTPGEPVDAGFAVLGSYACMDGVVPEVPRCMATRGAQIMLNSLNSFALDEASLHVPIRAAENRVWVVACCKVGPLLPADKEAQFADLMGVPAERLRGAGESQIVSPSGEVVAMASRDGDDVIYADIDTDNTGAPRPDGTDVWASRRPELYKALASPTPPLDSHPRSASLKVATASNLKEVRAALNEGANLVVVALDALNETGGGEIDGTALVGLIAELAPDAHVVAAADGMASLISATGVVGQQRQLHGSTNSPEADLATQVETFDLPWGRLGIVVGSDIVYPEVARLLALRNVDVIAVPLAAQETWETELAAVERAAENRVITVVANHPDAVGDSVIADLPPDFTLWAPSRERIFDGTINMPDCTRSVAGEPISAVVHPQRSVRRQISRGTNLVDGRPWELCGVLTEPHSR